jgi:hypothetical protein
VEFVSYLCVLLGIYLLLTSSLGVYIYIWIKGQKYQSDICLICRKGLYVFIAGCEVDTISLVLYPLNRFFFHCQLFLIRYPSNMIIWSVLQFFMGEERSCEQMPHTYLLLARRKKKKKNQNIENQTLSSVRSETLFIRINSHICYYQLLWH